MTHSTPVYPRLSIHPPENTHLSILRLHPFRVSRGRTVGLLPALGYLSRPVPTSELSALNILTATANFPPKTRLSKHDLFKKENRCLSPFEVW